LDTDGNWYYLSETHDGWFGHKMNGWYLDSSDNNWYYLNTVTGSMAKGWQQIGEKWYYLAEESQRATHTYGSMYRNELTPDGYFVDNSGAWEKETP
jgi:glucan-binding YG repeat protein